jgi:hypothetical protein
MEPGNRFAVARPSSVPLFLDLDPLRPNGHGPFGGAMGELLTHVG